jgi:hypothetical protein
MIDLFTTLLSTLVAVYVCFKAIKLDRSLPWFETRRLYDEAQKKALGAGTKQETYDRGDGASRQQPRPAR